MHQIDDIKKKLSVCKHDLEHGFKVKKLGVFGSYVRGEQTTASDLDILVEFSEPVSLIEFVHLENHLSDMLGIKVDLVMRTALKPRIGKHILEEVVQV
jgi:predicted nucleotidyltransferase